jgi:hypothetical protein
MGKKKSSTPGLSKGAVPSLLAFCGAFDISLPPYLSLAAAEYEQAKNKSINTKVFKNLKIASLRFIVESSHPALLDDMFVPIRKEALEVLNEINGGTKCQTKKNKKKRLVK